MCFVRFIVQKNEFVLAAKLNNIMKQVAKRKVEVVFDYLEGFFNKKLIQKFVWKPTFTRLLKEY